MEEAVAYGASNVAILTVVEGGDVGLEVEMRGVAEVDVEGVQFRWGCEKQVLVLVVVGLLPEVGVDLAVTGIHFKVQQHVFLRATC